MTLATPTQLTASQSTTGASSYVTASVSPSLGDVLIVYATGGRTDGAATPPTSVSGMGLTWTAAGSSATIPIGNLASAAFYATSDGTSGAITINFSGAQMNCVWSVIAQPGGVYQQANSGTAATTTPSLSLATAPAATSNVFGFCVNNGTSASIDPGSGSPFTEFSTEPNAGTPSVRMQSQWATGQQTSDWLAGNANQKTLAIVEIAEPTAGGSVAGIWNGASVDAGKTFGVWDGAASSGAAVIGVWNGTSMDAAHII